MDSLGGDYLVVEGGAVKGEGGEGVDRLQAACRATHRCLGECGGSSACVRQ